MASRHYDQTDSDWYPRSFGRAESGFSSAIGSLPTVYQQQGGIQESCAPGSSEKRPLELRKKERKEKKKGTV